jgi:hypothetical protein
MKKYILTVVACLVLTCCAFQEGGCDSAPKPTADQQTQARQEQMQRQQVAQTGMPGITNFTEAKLVKHLYELRDQKIVTYSYVPDLNGKLWHLCDSIGYGLPYSVQFSNPEKEESTPYSGVWYNLPQAEPNGLYMPSTAEGTWITCVDPSGNGEVQPLYVEPRVIVSPFKLRAEGEYAIK